MIRYIQLVSWVFCLFLSSCGAPEETIQVEAQGVVSWSLNEESFSKSGSWTYCDAEDFSGNFVIYGTSRIEGEGIIISINDDTNPVDTDQTYTFDQSTVGQLIYDDGNSNRWSSINDGGSGITKITLFSNDVRTVVEGTFSGTLINKDDNSTRVIEEGFFSVRCI